MVGVSILGLSKTFAGHKPVLDIDALEIQSGEMVALIGSSGSGKSTLLRHVAGLTYADRHGGAKPSQIMVGGSLIQQDGRPAPNIRVKRADIGMVFQQFNLVDRLPVLTNVLAGALARVPLWRSLIGHFPQSDHSLAMQALARVGILAQAHQRASTLSGGQQQRAAIARTLVQKAKIILADEPIASLDPESSRRVMEMLATINREEGITVIVSLHQVDYARRYCQRVIGLRGGRVVLDGTPDSLTSEIVEHLYAA